MTLDVADSPILSLREISVSFGATQALVDESLDVSRGEIVGLLGHNGAGKSTLLNVVTGAVKPSSGRMEVDGRDVALKGDPRQTESAAIKVIHQEPALAANLRVWENISLATVNERLSRAARINVARDALMQVGALDLDVHSVVGTLTFGQRQLVDIARAVATDLRMIMLDEPTAALGREETRYLHELLVDLAEGDRAVVYVSHRLKDVLDLCTRLVILREGRIVFDEPNVDVSVEELTDAFSASGTGVLRHDSSDRAKRSTPRKGVSALSVINSGQTLQFPTSQITGLFGMAADAQFDLVETLYGLRGLVDAELAGEPYHPKGPSSAKKLGVYFLSADREQDSLVHSMTAADNLTLPWLQGLSTRLGVSRRGTSDCYEIARRRLNIRGAGPSDLISAFSGGNRQKVALARWMLIERPTVLLLAQPTQGVDVTARVEIADALRELADSGITVVVASSEADEIDLLCDSSYVRQGHSWTHVRRPTGGRGFEEAIMSALLEREAV